MSVIGVKRSGSARSEIVLVLTQKRHSIVAAVRALGPSLIDGSVVNRNVMRVTARRYFLARARTLADVPAALSPAERGQQASGKSRL
jgi:hypothetical protein